MRINPYDPNSANGEPGMRVIYRRVLLIAPWLPPGFRRFNYDGKISVHNALREFPDPDASHRFIRVWVPNTLADCTRREYRFAHEYDSTTCDA